MPRLPNLDPADLSGYQKELYDRIATQRGAVRGPFNAWLYSPELCDRVEALGKYVRFDSDIDMHLKEIAVLQIARHFSSDYMWQAHVKFALRHGVSQEVIDAIGQGWKPEFATEPEETVYGYTRDLLSNHRVSDTRWQAMVDLLGARRVVEFTAFIGNFCMVALALNAFQVDLPEGAEILPELSPA